MVSGRKVFHFDLDEDKLKIFYPSESKRGYLCFDRWEEIAGEFGYSVRHIYRIHDEAIKNIRIP